MSAPGEEDQAVEAVVERLVERFPDVGRDRVQAVVDEELHRLDGGKVRDFIPVLAEHAARDRLREEAEPVRAPAPEGAGAAGVADDPPEIDPMEVERREQRRHGGFLFGDLGGGPS